MANELPELGLESSRRRRRRVRSRRRFAKGGAPEDVEVIEAETRADIGAELKAKSDALRDAKELGLKTREQAEKERFNLETEKYNRERNRISRLGTEAKAERNRQEALKLRQKLKKPSIVESIFSKGS